jgi:hypothetical protein
MISNSTALGFAGMSHVGLGRIQDFTARCRSDAGCLAIGKES